MDLSQPPPRALNVRVFCAFLFLVYKSGMKKKIQTCISMLAVCLAAGCYSSAPPHDGASDPAADPTHDPVYDPTYDPGYDPGYDPYPDPPYDPYTDPSYDPYYDPWVDPDVPPVCPRESGVSVGFEISGAPTTGPDGLERECRVEWSITDEPEWFQIGLGCPEADGLIALYTIDAWAMPAVFTFLPEGTPVTFSYVEDYPWWMNRWFSIRYSGGTLLMAGVDATDLAPYGRDPYEWYSPLGVSLATGYCPWMPGDCGDEERVALSVSFEGMSDFVFDGNETMIGMWSMVHVLVDTAVVYNNVWCEDFYDSWIRALFVSMPVR